jgi:hypothetical protein
MALACDDLATCAEHGDTKACACEGGERGVQTCLPERVWNACECSAPSRPVDAGAAGGGGSSGEAGGGGAAGTSGASGATPPPLDGGDDDGGAEPEPGGSGGAGAGAGGGGAGGDGGMGGSGGSAGAMSAAYRGCMDMNDCDAAASCEMSTPPVLEAPLGVCSPDCLAVGDCPVPEGTYDAAVSCVEGRCRLDCTEELPLVPRTCPSGMTCAAGDLLGVASYCYDDGT